MTYFIRSNPATDSSIRVHVWSGDQFLPKDIAINTIRQFSDSGLSPSPELQPTIETVIETTHGVLFVRETIDELCLPLYSYLFNPPALRGSVHQSAETL